MPFVERVRTSQPLDSGVGVDWGNPITRGLVLLTLPGESNVNLVNGAVYGDTLPTKMLGKSGIGGTHSTGHSTVKTSGLGQDYSVFTFGEITTAGIGSVALADDDISGVRAFDLGTGATNAAMTVFDNASGFTSVFSSATFSAADLAAGIRIGGAVTSAGAVAVWYNGLKTTGSLGAAPRAPQPTLQVCSRLSNDYPSTRPVYLCAAWNRVLSDAEMQSLDKFPWQLFETERVWVAVTPLSTITQANGVSTTGTLAGSALALRAPTAAAGTSTTGTLAGFAIVAAALTAAAGTSTTGALVGFSTTAAAITPAAGVSTTSTLAGLATASAAITAAAGTSTTSTLVGAGAAAGTGGVASAAGVSTTSALAGLAAASAAITPAAGVSTTGTLIGVGTIYAAITAAAGTSTTGPLAGVGATYNIPTPANGVSTTSTLGGFSAAVSAITAASGTSTTSSLTGAATVLSAITSAAGLSTTYSLSGYDAGASAPLPASISISAVFYGKETKLTIATRAASIVNIRPLV